MVSEYPQRIVCLSDETTETLYRLGAQDLVVGVSALSTRPEAAMSKPKVSSFVTAQTEKILDLQPDLVLTYSDLQADIAADLIRAGLSVVSFNQRSVAEIFEAIHLLSRIVRLPERGDRLVQELRSTLEEISAAASRFACRPRVFFEEWPDPLISGIEWVEELIEIAGGDPVFPELRRRGLAADRTVTQEDVAKRSPDVIVASWCGKPFDRDSVVNRSAWSEVPAVREGRVFEIESS
ncbi:MAG: cobalamin-binding protein, partial [Planctomycetota bacterium]